MENIQLLITNYKEQWTLTEMTGEKGFIWPIPKSWDKDFLLYFAVVVIIR